MPWRSHCSTRNRSIELGRGNCPNVCLIESSQPDRHHIDTTLSNISLAGSANRAFTDGDSSLAPTMIHKKVRVSSKHLARVFPQMPQGASPGEAQESRAGQRSDLSPGLTQDWGQVLQSHILHLGVFHPTIRGGCVHFDLPPEPSARETHLAPALAHLRMLCHRLS